MFFFLSKILSFLINPFFWFFCLLIVGLLVKKLKFRRILITTSLVVFYLFSNKFLLHVVVNQWQTKPLEIEALSDKYDYGIVLGGFSSYEEQTETLNFHETTDRLLYAVKMYYQGRVDKIVISSGSGNLINNQHKEADYVRDFLISINFPEEDIIVENRSKNTFENAKFTVELLKEQSDSSSFLLFTSSMHMKRARACFQKQGLDVDIYVVDYLTGFEDFSLNYYFFPKYDVILAWRWVFHEIIGYYVYRVAGYL
jgi:uncharacterized SAM-binding protein YcdF (DUF218 family)